MAEEFSGDRSLTFDFISSFNQVQAQLSNKKCKPKGIKDDVITNALSAGIIRSLSDEFDELEMCLLFLMIVTILCSLLSIVSKLFYPL